MFLALTLFGGAGAWAQGPTAAELTIPASWNNDQTPITAADLPGFVAVDSATADQWVDASTSGYAMLIYAFTTDGKAKCIRFEPGFVSWETVSYSRNAAYEDYDYDFQVFYTTGGGAIELTKVGDNQWTLGQAPDYDLELQVEYYEPHALKNIPAGWQIKVNGVDQTSAIVGDSLMITETDSVTLVPDNPNRVKSVTLEEDAPDVQTLTIGKGSTQLSGDKELYYITGDTYRQALARPENQSGNDLGWGVWESSTLTTIFFKEVSNKAWDMAIDGDSNFTPGEGSSTITLDSVIDPNHAFQFISTK